MREISQLFFTNTFSFLVWPVFVKKSGEKNQKHKKVEKQISLTTFLSFEICKFSRLDKFSFFVYNPQGGCLCKRIQKTKYQFKNLKREKRMEDFLCTHQNECSFLSLQIQILEEREGGFVLHSTHQNECSFSP